MREDGKIDYVEFPGADLSEIKRFYGEAFGWTFQDYGPAYVAFEGAGLDGGFDADRGEAVARPMVVLFARELEAMLEKIRGAGGVITRPILSFPGGRRFHFRDPSGNELGVWSET
jgi:predicted enzyme related to lactoylglutathione lyase